MLKHLFPIVFIVLIAAAMAIAEDAFYEQVISEYPAESFLVGIGQKNKSNNVLADKRVTEVLARSEIAKQIRVRVKEETVDIMCEKSSSALFQDKEACRNEFSMVVEVTVDEFLEGTRIVKHGDKDGMAYAVAVMPKAGAVERLNNNIQNHVNNAKDSIEKARQGESGSIDKARDEYMKAVVNERERELIEGVKGSSSKLFGEMEKEIADLKEKGELK